MKTCWLTLWCWVLCVVLGWVGLAHGQPADRGAGGADGGVAFEDLPAELRLGLRVRAMETRWPVARVLVVADSAEAYVEAVGSWSIERRFPVLIDDGSADAVRMIRRFVESFEPERVVFVSARDSREWAGRGGEDGVGREIEFPGREAIDDAVARVWDAGSVDRLADVWRGLGWVPPGLVAVSEGDGGWAGGLALAAGRGQPFVWVDEGRGNVSGVMDAARAAALDSALEAAASGYEGVEWRGLGEGIDAVTLCVNVPARVRSEGEDGVLALTDVLGRDDSGARWAWVGQVHGSAVESAYRAMSALFVDLGSGFVFDGYGKGFAPPYAGDGAVDLFGEADVAVDAVLAPRGTAEGWREAVAGGIGAELVLVTTKGMAEWFDLLRGRAWAGEVGLLRVPAAVHFVHSFSAQRVGDPLTIAGAWLEGGAFAYAGSVAEPMLGAFRPPTVVVARLFTGVPWGAAVRQEGGRFGRAWKVAVFGDPLFCLGEDRVYEIGEEEALLDGAAEVSAVVAHAAGERAFGRLARVLAMVGRDGALLDLARARLGEGGGAVEREFAGAALVSGWYSGDADVVIAAFDRLDELGREDRWETAALWDVLGDELRRDTVDERSLMLLRANPRVGSLVADAALLEASVRRVWGQDAVIAMWESFLGMAANPRIERELRRSMPK